MTAPIFSSHECAPEAEIEEAPRLLHIDLAQFPDPQRLARRKRQVIKCANAIEEVTHLLLVREIEYVALSPFGKASDGTINALTPARSNDNHCTLSRRHFSGR